MASLPGTARTGRASAQRLSSSMRSIGARARSASAASSVISGVPSRRHGTAFRACSSSCTGTRCSCTIRRRRARGSVPCPGFSLRIRCRMPGSVTTMIWRAGVLPREVEDAGRAADVVGVLQHGRRALGVGGHHGLGVRHLQLDQLPLAEGLVDLARARPEHQVAAQLPRPPSRPGTGPARTPAAGRAGTRRRSSAALLLVQITSLRALVAAEQLM